MKITGLTHFNVLALKETFPDAIAEGDIVLTSTTATWTRASAPVAIASLDAAMSRMPTKGHPRSSLHAVRRKLVKLT